MKRRETDQQRRERAALASKMHRRRVKLNEGKALDPAALAELRAYERSTRTQKPRKEPPVQGEPVDDSPESRPEPRPELSREACESCGAAPGDNHRDGCDDAGATVAGPPINDDDALPNIDLRTDEERRAPPKAEAKPRAEPSAATAAASAAVEGAMMLDLSQVPDVWCDFIKDGSAVLRQKGWPGIPDVLVDIFVRPATVASVAELLKLMEQYKLDNKWVNLGIALAPAAYVAGARLYLERPKAPPPKAAPAPEPEPAPKPAEQPKAEPKPSTMPLGGNT
jgi:hypothetical protein